MKNALVIATIAALIGIPATALVLHYSFGLSHGAGGFGSFVLLLTVPGLLVAPYGGMVGIVLVQILYYVVVAMILKALFLRFFFEQVEDAS